MGFSIDEFSQSYEDGIIQNNVYNTYFNLQVFDKILILERNGGESDALVNLLTEEGEFDVTVLNVYDSEEIPTTVDELRQDVYKRQGRSRVHDGYGRRCDRRVQPYDDGEKRILQLHGAQSNRPVKNQAGAHSGKRVLQLFCSCKRKFTHDVGVYRKFGHEDVYKRQQQNYTSEMCNLQKKKNDENKLTMWITFATIFTIHYTEGQKGRANEKESV